MNHFWRANNLVKFWNTEKCSWTPKYHGIGHPSVKVHLVMLSHRGDMIISPHPIFEWGCNLNHFDLFVLGPTHFLLNFLGYGSKFKIRDFVLGCKVNIKRKNQRADKSWRKNKE